MSFFKNLFGMFSRPGKEPGKGAAQISQVSRPTQPQPGDPAENKDLIRVFDSYGRELFLTRQQWRDDVLLANIKAVWNKPDELYQMIVSALQDGFRADVVGAAGQLYKIDPNRDRAACIWGIVLLEEKRLDEAEKVLRRQMDEHGEQGFLLTNLAKVYHARNEPAKAMEILWHGLELDPNQDNGMAWFHALHRERGGDETASEALRRVAALPASWRAQVWLAREALEARQLDAALTWYRESLDHAGVPVPTDLLMQMSGDLGQRGHLPELLNLTEPYFDVNAHGLQVGNNLIKAHLDLGQVDEARRIMEQLYALKRPDWKPMLNFWDTEIAKTQVATTPAIKPQDLQLNLLTLKGSIWLRPEGPAAELFPATDAAAPAICFLGATAELPATADSVQMQMSDGPGRLSRALPLFLAEQIEHGAVAQVRTLVPWIQGESGGFMLAGAPWTEERAAEYARHAEPKCDYVVVTHLKTAAEPWQAELRLVRTLDAQCVGRLGVSVPPQAPGEAVFQLAGELLALLERETDLRRKHFPAAYELPAHAELHAYLLRLEQLLAIRCSGNGEKMAGRLSGEREMIDGNLQLCVACPRNVTTRILLAQTLLSMKKIRPDILPEFKEKLELLQKQYPLPEPANAVIQRMFHDAFVSPGPKPGE